ncbi:MAG: hypothetical protein ACODAQ_05510 [Phycisphaeraceae bacterium]
MKSISQFIVDLANLLEVEGRTAKRAIFRLVLSLILLVLFGVLALATVGLFAAAIFLWFAELLGSAAAALAILGGIMLLLTVIGLLGSIVVRDFTSGKRR